MDASRCNEFSGSLHCFVFCRGCRGTHLDIDAHPLYIHFRHIHSALTLGHGNHVWCGDSLSTVFLCWLVYSLPGNYSTILFKGYFTHIHSCHCFSPVFWFHILSIESCLAEQTVCEPRSSSALPPSPSLPSNLLPRQRPLWAKWQLSSKAQREPPRLTKGSFVPTWPPPSLANFLSDGELLAQLVFRFGGMPIARWRRSYRKPESKKLTSRNTSPPCSSEHQCESSTPGHDSAPVWCAHLI